MWSKCGNAAGRLLPIPEFLVHRLSFSSFSPYFLNYSGSATLVLNFYLLYGHFRSLHSIIVRFQSGIHLTFNGIREIIVRVCRRPFSGKRRSTAVRVYIDNVNVGPISKNISTTYARRSEIGVPLKWSRVSRTCGPVVVPPVRQRRVFDEKSVLGVCRKHPRRGSVGRILVAIIDERTPVVTRGDGRNVFTTSAPPAPV